MVSGAQWRTFAGKVRHLPYGAAITRLVEVLLVALGLAYVFLANGSADSEIKYLSWFDLVALGYLLVGFWVVRRQRRAEPIGPDRTGARRFERTRRRFSFTLTIAASLAGLSAAVDVITHGDTGDTGSAVKVLGVIGVFCAWSLLQVGYAGFYRSLDVSAGAPGLSFPDCDHPSMIEYLYFSITIGVAFAVSDVSVTRRPMRWHVLVHSIIAFFYNSAVLAVAVGVITGR